MDDRFRLLTGGSRTALPRQQTLRALIDWSWELLTEKEQVLLERLSVFAGGMDFEAVEAVCSGDGLDAYDLIEVLGELVNKSLVIVRREQGQETRYMLLETIRQYAQERLMFAGQGGVYRRRHLDYFLGLAEEAEPELVGPGQVGWIQRLEKEVDNMRAALSWALETDVQPGLRLTSASWRFWRFGYVREGEKWLAKLLAGAEEVDPEVKAKALWVQGWFNIILFDLDRGRLLAEESLAIYRELGDMQRLAYRKTLLGYFLDWGDHRDLLLQSIKILRESDNKLGLAEALTNIAYTEAELNNFEQAYSYLKESEQLFGELGHLVGIVDVLIRYAQFEIWKADLDSAQLRLNEVLAIEESSGRPTSYYSMQLLGDVSFWRGEYGPARTFYEKGLALSREAGDIYSANWTLVRLGYVLLREGNLVRAQKILDESQQLFKKAGQRVGVVFALERLASLAVILEEPERTARLLGWADVERAAIQDARPPIEQQDLDCDIAVAQEMMGREAYAAAYASGQSMTMDEAIALALFPPALRG